MHRIVSDIFMILVKESIKIKQRLLNGAEAGNQAAQNSVGHCYETGKGINKDDREAFKWYLKSAKAGNNNAQYNLGICYQCKIGIHKDKKKRLLNGIRNLPKQEIMLRKIVLDIVMKLAGESIKIKQRLSNGI